MILRSPWPDAFWRLLGIVAAALLVGALIDDYVLSLLVAAVFVLAFQYRNLYRLDQWLRKSRKITPPEAEGVWGSIFYEMDRRRKRERKRNKRLIKIVKRFEDSAIALPDAVVGMNENFETLWWNEKAAYLLGLRHPKDRGRRIHNLVRQPAFASHLNQKRFDAAVTIQSPVHPSVTLEIRVVLYGEHESMLIARDVSESQRVNQMRKDFVANVSHELRTPLTVLRGTTELLEDVTDQLPAQLHKSVNLMAQQTHRMQCIVEDLLSLSKIESDKPVAKNDRIVMTLLVADLHAEANALSDGKHLFIMEIDPTIVLLGNESELRSAFSNLLSNAVRYTPAGGKITIRWYKQNSQAVFEVIDSGIGIAAAHIPRLTERFYRVDVGRSRDVGGTGLGLAIVKHVLIRHQARLDILSSENRGSTFRCVFNDSWYVIDQSLSKRDLA